MATQLTIPLFVEKVANTTGFSYEVNPVFHTKIRSNDKREDQAIERATQNLRSHLSMLTKESNHEALCNLSFCPELANHQLVLNIRLRKMNFHGKFFFVAFRMFERRIFYSPKMPELCFQVNRGESPEQIASDFLTEYFRKEEKDNTGVNPEHAASPLFSRITYVSIETNVQQKAPQKEQFFNFASIGSTEEVDGAQELESTGRCINRLYPRRIKRAILRDAIVEKIYQDFNDESDHMRPVVLVGPSQVGKSCIIHEVVARRIEKRDTKQNQMFWLLSPQRLISGMQYVGQWENRFLGILEFVTKKKHILYFDDLLGLFQAGLTRDSNLSVADLLKAHIQQNSTRIIAEATPEQWRLLKEKDRSFADMFEVVPVQEPTELETQKILIRVMQQLEVKHKCRFGPEVIPTVMKLQKRYVRTRSFPGKAAEFLEQLTSKSSSEIDENSVFVAFQEKSGIHSSILNDQNGLHLLDKADASFENQIVGQKAAVEAITNTILMAKTKLNDPDRPLASLLFLGPTGVGKTECAKALAQFLFNSKERLIRFDMNEFVDATATARLVGNDIRSQGLLTTAVRRNPFSVILLDEIEKAHSSVFDLLLQLLGEGRLTDAAGQTADFCNCIIILTSNLGASSNASQMGFSKDVFVKEQVYAEAAEKFFRPELFNRIDKIVPFHELDRSHISEMVRKMAWHAIDRFGIKQRKMTLSIDDEVFDFITDKGFDVEYGARTLRRSIESHLVQPIANELVTTLDSNMGTMNITLKDGVPNIHKEVYQEAARIRTSFTEISTDHADEVVQSTYDFIEIAEDELEQINQDLGTNLQDKEPYYDLLEQLNELKIKLEKLEHELEVVCNPQKKVSTPPRIGKYTTCLHPVFLTNESIFEQMNNAGDTGYFLKNLADDSEVQSFLAYRAEQVMFSVNMLSHMLDYRTDVQRAEIAVSFNSPHSRVMLNALDQQFGNLNWYLDSGEVIGHPDTREPSNDHLKVKKASGQGVGYRDLISYAEGIHLEFESGGNILLNSIKQMSVENLTTTILTHSNLPYYLDLRTGVIQQKEYFSLFNHIAPLLPIAPELQEISDILYSHG